MNVLFVCLGNICRSPTAEGVFLAIAGRDAPHLMVQADSAGTANYHIGAPPDRRSQRAARDRGYDLSALRARQVETGDFERFDLLLAMDSENLQNMLRLAPTPAHARKAQLIMDQAPDHPLREVPDPYFGGDAGFDEVHDMLHSACNSLIHGIDPR